MLPTVVDAIDTALTSYSSVQDQKLYHLGKHRDKSQHEIRKKESKTIFGSEQRVGKQTHMLEIFKDLNEQYAQLHADLYASMKENGMFLVSIIFAFKRDRPYSPYMMNNSFVTFFFLSLTQIMTCTIKYNNNFQLFSSLLLLCLVTW